MTIYLLKSNPERYESFCFKNENDADVIYQFDGTPISHWVPISVETDNENSCVKLGSDFPSLIGHIPIFSQRAADALKHILEPNGQLLPLDYNKGKYYAFNVTKLIDALDIERSDIVRFSTGRIMDIIRYEFIANKLDKDLTIFKLLPTPTLRVFVTDTFAQLINSNGLTGFDLKPVWSTSEK